MSMELALSIVIIVIVIVMVVKLHNNRSAINSSYNMFVFDFIYVNEIIYRCKYQVYWYYLYFLIFFINLIYSAAIL